MTSPQRMGNPNEHPTGALAQRSPKRCSAPARTTTLEQKRGRTGEPACAPRRARTAWGRFASLALALFGLLSGSAWAIPYTVQVVAISDESRARALEAQLLESGFAAYILTVPTPQGLIHRLRIGAFADRESAARFARALSPPGGDSATPALAESIPDDLLPLLPDWLGRFPPGSDVRVLPSPAGPVLRARTEGALEASYYLPDGQRISAFRLMPDPEAPGEGWLVVRAVSLVGSGGEPSGTVLENVALTLGQDAAALEPYVFTLPDRAPFVVVAERWRARGERQRLPALGDPARGLGPYGPELHWFGADPGDIIEIRDPDPLWTLPDTPTPVPSVTGDGWQAENDGGFVRLTREGRSWRAVPGAPLWGADDLLAVWDEGAVVFYALLEPAE